MSARLRNRVRDLRETRGWSQQELADRAGLSRAGVSAIEGGRLEPSTAAALALARALGMQVEALFALAEPVARWAWAPAGPVARFWSARVGGETLCYPAESGGVPHDGVARDSALPRDSGDLADRTLVIAGCDPAGGILAAEAARQERLRVVPLARSSGEALALLERGLVHAAGVHLGGSARDGNAAVVHDRLGQGYSLARVADWEEGLAMAPERRIRSTRGALRARLRWIGREAGSGARKCQDELGAGGSSRHVARDHRGVAEAIRSGYADAGVCVRLVSEEAGLSFLPVQTEPYDLCFATASKDDWRISALCRVLQSKAFRRLVGDLPGYDSTRTGAVRRA